MRTCVPLFFGLLVVAAALNASAGESGPSKVPDDAVLARVEDQVVTVGNFRREMETRGGNVPGMFATEEQRRALLEEMIRFRAMVIRAKAEGLDRDPDVVAVFERAMVEKYRGEHLGASDLEISDEEVEAYFAAHQSQFQRPERFKAAIIRVSLPRNATPENREKAGEKIEQALEETRKLAPGTTHFGPVARRYSDDRASRYTGGVIGWLVDDPRRHYKWDRAVLEAVFSLSEPGEIAPVVRTDEGLYLVRLVDHEDAQTRPLEVLAPGIRQRLRHDKNREALDQFEADLLEGMKVEISEDLVSEISPPSPEVPKDRDNKPPRLPEG